MRVCICSLWGVLFLTGCAGGNVQSARDYDAPAAPLLRHPTYDAYAPYGSAPATWTPPIANRDGTIVRPLDPNVTIGRPDYEHARGATGAAGGSENAPPGTF
jgi:hypothetical protein